jgi:hypothetical protein
VKIFTDAGGIIEHEWANLVDPVWFQAWLADQLVSGKLIQVQASASPAVARDLYTLGFPRKRSRDIWYIRTAQALLAQPDAPRPGYLVSEDVDFYDPKIKNGDHKTRVKTIKESKGPIARYLRRNLAIEVLCVSNCTY